MKATNTARVFEENPVVSNEKLVSAVDNESMEGLLDHYDEPGYFFRGAVFGLILCVPFWAAILWLVI